MVAQTANILLYLGPAPGPCARREADRLFTHQLQLTVADLVAEAHDTHHPVGGDLYYEDQKPEARAAGQEFREQRIGKFLGYFERVLAANPVGDGHLVGGSLTYVDLSLFQVVEGLRYAFPSAMAGWKPDWPRVDRPARPRRRPAHGRRLPGLRSPHRLQQRRHLPPLPGTGRRERSPTREREGPRAEANGRVRGYGLSRLS